MKAYAERERVMPSSGELREACSDTEELRFLALLASIAQQTIEDLAWALEVGLITVTGRILPKAEERLEQKRNGHSINLEELQTAVALVQGPDGEALCQGIAALSRRPVISPRWMLGRAVKLAAGQVGSDPMVKALRADQDHTRNVMEHVARRDAEAVQYRTRCREEAARAVRRAIESGAGVDFEPEELSA